MVMYLVKLNLAIKVHEKVHEKFCMTIHVLTEPIKCPIQYLQESFKSGRSPREKKTEIWSITERDIKLYQIRITCDRYLDYTNLLM
jgi:hypothetical protein